MANDIARTLDRNRAILTNLLRQLPTADRDLHLTRLADFYQERIDDVLGALDNAPPSVRPRGRPPIVRLAEPPAPTYVPTPPVIAPAPVVALPIAPPVVEHEHTPACEHVRAAVEHADSATVPGAIRAVLATENAGLLPRQIIEGVRILRPETPEESVHGALHQMRKRGELAREGFHRNFRYRLTGQGSLTSLGAGVLSVANGNDAGGATH
jgi:hypothetical protein